MYSADFATNKCIDQESLCLMAMPIDLLDAIINLCTKNCLLFMCMNYIFNSACLKKEGSHALIHKSLLI